MDGIGQRFTNEILNLAGIMYRFLFRPVILLGFIGISFYYLYVSVICENASSIPFMYKYCPGREINVLSYLPLENLTHNTVSLAEALSNADASAPTHCVEARSAFIEIRAEIIHSDIQPQIRDKLVEILGDLQKLTDKGAEQSSTMLASYNKALDAAKIHTEFLLDDLSKSKSSNNYQTQQLQIVESWKYFEVSYLETISIDNAERATYKSYDFFYLESSSMKKTDLATGAFDDYTVAINTQIDNALRTTQDFDTTLKLIIGKIEILQDLVKKGKRVNNLELDQLLIDSWWTWIFGKDVANIRKHQRNIKTLDEFNDFIRKVSKNVGEVITNLLLFKASATNVKEAAADLSTLPYKSPERQLQIVKASVNRLVQAKHAFEKKLEQKNSEKYIS